MSEPPRELARSPVALPEVTVLLEAASSGDESARKKVFAIVYRELHALAHQAMRDERVGHTLQTTALVHEAYLRLVRSDDAGWASRAHFFSAAATALRRILVDEARKRKAVKRGEGRPVLSLDEKEDSTPGLSGAGISFDELEALDEALAELAADPAHVRKCRVVELRFFVGLGLEETAKVLQVSTGTVKRDWEITRAWLRREIKRRSGVEP